MPCCPTWLELPAAGPTYSGRLGAPLSAFTIVAPAATARNNADARNSVLDPRDTRIIANRAATVVNEVWVLTWEIIIWSSLRYFCPPCFTMTHECPRVCVRISPSTTRRETASTVVARMSGRYAGASRPSGAAPDIAPLEERRGRRSRMGRAKRNPSSHSRVMAGDGFRCALPILRPELRLLCSPHERSDLRERHVRRAPVPDIAPLIRATSPAIRSSFLTIFWHCGRPQNSSRTGPERASRQRTVNGFG